MYCLKVSLRCIHWSSLRVSSRTTGTGDQEGNGTGTEIELEGGKKKKKKSKKPRTEQYKRAMIKEEKLIILASSWVSRSIPDILTLTKYKWAGITRNTKGREKK